MSGSQGPPTSHVGTVPLVTAAASDDWHLCSWESYDEVTKTHSTSMIRPARPGEVDSLREASGLLNRFLSYGPYADYLDATEKLHEAVDAVERAWSMAKGTPPQTEVRSLQAAVKTWLAALRSFDDRTSKWLSERFGKGDVYNAFHQELSAEYDRNFAYRLSYALRNESEHANRVLNHIRVGSREDADGRRVHRVELGFDAGRLATDFPKLKAAVRHELADYGDVLGLDAVVGHATQTLERVMAATLLAAQSEVEAALRVVEDLHAEAEAVGGAAANFMTTVGAGGGSMSLIWVEIHVARAVRGNLAASPHILAITPLSTTAADLAL